MYIITYGHRYKTILIQVYKYAPPLFQSQAGLCHESGNDDEPMPKQYNNKSVDGK